MSLFRRVFGIKDRDPTTPEAVSKLDEVLVRIEKRTAFLETKIDEQTEIAKSNAKNNRRAALNALSKKRRYVKELSSLDNTASTVEYQREALCNASAQTEMFKAMEAGAKALEAAQRHLGIDDAEALLDKVEDQIQVSEEMRSVFSRPLFGSDMDEDELQEELDDLEQEALDEQLTSVGASVATPVPAKPPPATGTGVARLPSVPSHTPGRTQAGHRDSHKDDRELQELADWANAAM